MSHAPQQTVVVQQAPSTSALAIAGLIFAILGWFTCGLLCIPGAFLCFLALFARGPKAAAIAGLIVGFPGTLFFAFVGLGFIMSVLGIGGAAVSDVTRNANAVNLNEAPRVTEDPHGNESVHHPDSNGSSLAANRTIERGNLPYALGEFGNIEVELLNFGVAKIRLTHLGNTTASEDELLFLTLRITNRSKTKKVSYKTWRGSNYSFGRDFSTATDNFGNILKRIDFGFGTEIQGAVDTDSIYPGKSLEDTLVFEQPVDGTTTVVIELPCENFGEIGDPIIFELSIPSADPDLRMWTDASGADLAKAKYVKSDDTSVTLEKANGEQITVRLNALSETSKNWVYSIKASISDTEPQANKPREDKPQSTANSRAEDRPSPKELFELSMRQKLEEEKRVEEEQRRAEEEKRRLAEEAKWRTWTTADGKFSVEAMFIKYLAGTVTLEKRDGATVDVKLEILSAEDQDFIKERGQR